MSQAAFPLCNVVPGAVSAREVRPGRSGIVRAMRCLAGLLIGLVLAGCSLAPRYERPQMDLPSSWRNVPLGEKPLDVDWWTRFGDPTLTALIEEALAHNQDIAQSLARIDSAAAQAGVATSRLFPTVTGQGQAGSQGLSERAGNVPMAYGRQGLSRSFTQYQLGFQAAWELDFWGKYRNTRTALTDILQSTILGYEALQLSVAGETAKDYFALLALDMQLDTARRTLKTREDAFGIYTSRYNQGDITELDWQRARAEVEAARAVVHSSIVAVDQMEAALAVLIGRSPRDIMEGKIARGGPIAKLPSPPVLPADLPSTLLERRPDVRAAEYGIMASNANIGVARAMFFPSISLTGMMGTISSSVGNLFKGTAGAWNYGVSGTLPILDFGNNWYNLKDAEAQKQASIAAYRKAVQSAFQDVRTALTAQGQADAIVRSMAVQAQSLRRAVEIARLQYDNGYSDYLTVLDAERQLFSVELDLAQSLSNRLNAVVNVCMALGGGWREPVSDAEPAQKATTE